MKNEEKKIVGDALPSTDSANCILHSAFSFPRSHRLSGKLAFSAVYDARRKVTRGPLAMYSLANTLGHFRLGISISRKVGTAPKRNRIKRLLRESFRLHRFEKSPSFDLIVVVRQHVPLELQDYQRLLGEMVFKGCRIGMYSAL